MDFVSLFNLETWDHIKTPINVFGMLENTRLAGDAMVAIYMGYIFKKLESLELRSCKVVRSSVTWGGGGFE